MKIGIITCQKGIEIIPTLFVERTDHLDLSELKIKDWKKWVIKPAISASAYLTEVFSVAEISTIEEKYRSVAKERDLLIQRFMPEIQSFGELSIFFFNRKYSHTVRKTAEANEFRVQKDYGGKAEIYHPDNLILNTAKQILAQFKGDILYARVDGLLKNNSFILMEIELIEPELFFDYGVNTREVFVEAAMELIQNFPGKK